MTTKNTLWSITSSLGRHYLLGSVHCLREEDYPLADAIESVFNRSSATVFETNQFDLSPKELAELVASRGHYSDGKLLTDHVGSETIKMLGEKATELQIEMDQLSTMKPWLLTFVLNLLVANKIGLDGKHGIDTALGARAKLSHKQLLYLET